MQRSSRHTGLSRVLAILGLGCIVAMAMAARDGKETEVTRVVEKPLHGKVIFQTSRTVGSGRIKKAQVGADGIDRKTFIVTMKGNKPISKKLIKEEKIQPRDTLMLLGRAGYEPSRHAFSRSKVMYMSATAYDPSPATIGRHATGRTCTGMVATYGCIAVDPRVIPLGTLLYVEGYGMGIASDRGGAIKGNRIDLCYDSRSVANSFGRKTVKVHILKPR